MSTNCLLNIFHVSACLICLCGAEKNVPLGISGEVEELWLAVPEELLFLRKDNDVGRNTPLLARASCARSNLPLSPTAHVQDTKTARGSEPARQLTNPVLTQRDGGSVSDS